MFHRRKTLSPDIIRSFIFGVEDSLVSTVGLVSGIAIANSSWEFVVITGIILIFVEAFSMAVGMLVSDNSAREAGIHKGVSLFRSVPSAIVMFISYLLSGFVVISPYVFMSFENAFVASIILSVVCLFFLGLASGKLTRIHPVKKGVLMALVGGAAIALGAIVGLLIQNIIMKL